MKLKTAVSRKCRICNIFDTRYYVWARTHNTYEFLVWGILDIIKFGVVKFHKKNHLGLLVSRTRLLVSQNSAIYVSNVFVW